MHRIIDMHVHTHHSGWDCQCPMEAYLRRIDRGEAEAIGFADHYHPFMEVHPGPEQLSSPEKLFDCDRYAAEVRGAQGRGYRVYLGLEVTHDEDKDVMAHALRELRRQPYDYLIGSVHRVGTPQGSVGVSKKGAVNAISDPALMGQVIHSYYDDILDVLTYPQYTVVGHVDIYKRGLHLDSPLLTQNGAVIRERMGEVAKALAESEKLVEINTSSYTGPGEEFMPGAEMLRTYRRLGGERICFASDAHGDNRLTANFAEARELAKSLGFRYHFYPWEPDRALSL